MVNRLLECMQRGTVTHWDWSHVLREFNSETFRAGGITWERVTKRLLEEEQTANSEGPMKMKLVTETAVSHATAHSVTQENLPALSVVSPIMRLPSAGRT